MTTTVIIMTDLVEDLAAYGMNTEVVCAQPTYIKDLGIKSNSGIGEFRNSGIRGSVDWAKCPRIECHHGVAILGDIHKNIKKSRAKSQRKKKQNIEKSIQERGNREGERGKRKEERGHRIQEIGKRIEDR